MVNLLRRALIIALILVIIPMGQVQAARGEPGSTEFGYGAWLHPEGAYYDQGLALLKDLALDWVAIDVDWAALAPTATTPINTSNLDRAFTTASSNNTNILLSLTNPPDWAMTSTGPNAQMVAALLLDFHNRYGETLCAVELLPGANTAAGWKAIPNPADYAAFITTVSQNLAAVGVPIHLIAGGLRPPSAASSSADWDDLEFLRGLYTSGAADWMNTLSLQFTALTGQPLQNIDQVNVFRHYEAVRQVMLENGHTSGRIWVTLINTPDGTINASDSFFADRQHQTEWLQQALIQVRSQLYVGAAFAQNLNPAQNNSGIFRSDALVIDRASVHPFYAVFKALIRQTNPETGNTRPGRPKGTTLLKCKYKT